MNNAHDARPDDAPAAHTPPFKISQVTDFGANGPAAEWQRYCGFFGMRIDEFGEIQARLLNEQLDLLAATSVGRMLFKGRRPASLSEFRERVPLTTYGDYVDLLNEQPADVLGGVPLLWAHTTGAQADYKWVPYTQRGLERLLDNLMGCFIAAAAEREGQIAVGPGSTVLYNTPERPYLSGIVTFGMSERFGFRPVIPPAQSEHLDFRDRIQLGYRKSIGRRVDIVVSMTSVLAKIGEEFGKRSAGSSLSWDMLTPRGIWRLAQAWVRSKVLRREVLPRHLWPTKAIIGWGIDTAFFKDRVGQYWGRDPYEVYACTEGGVMAMQRWDRGGMIFNPYADYFEFIPLGESLRSRSDDRIQPKTVLLNEVQPGETYEVVITNFYGMALARYRVGHFVRCLDRDAAPGSLPEFELLERADERIDLAGFTRLDQKTLWEALATLGIQHQNWAARKDILEEGPVLHMYLEVQDGEDQGNLEYALDEAIRSIDPFYQDLHHMLELRPLRLTTLRAGTFERFYEARREQGFDLGRRTPPRMNAGDEDIAELLSQSG